MSATGTIYGVGLGPGEPELMSVKADRLIRGARHIAYFRKSGRKGHARQIVEGLLRTDVDEFAMEYPVTTEIPLADPRYNEVLGEFYETVSLRLRKRAEAGQDVAVLCEGDPFFYGSFMHLYTRLKDHVPVHVIPAITGMSAAWTATGSPITWGDDVFTALMGTLPQDQLEAHMRRSDALVIMKIGRNLTKICAALKDTMLYHRAWIVEYATHPQQRVVALDEYHGDAPYFSIIVVHGKGRRP